jgi:cytochrome b561
MSAESARYAFTSRLLHWVTAPMILAMLFIGIGMAATVSDRYRVLVSVHKPLGIAILVLVLVRLVNRWFNKPPTLPDSMPALQRVAAKASHVLLYALMFSLPLVGWAMLSAERYPIILYGPIQLPPMLPYNIKLYASLRSLHTYLAYLLFLTFLAHLGAALYHGLIRRDAVFAGMASTRQ